MSNLVKPINLADDEKATLEGILRQSTVEARTYIRAKIPAALKRPCRTIKGAGVKRRSQMLILLGS